MGLEIRQCWRWAQVAQEGLCQEGGCSGHQVAQSGGQKGAGAGQGTYPPRNAAQGSQMAKLLGKSLRSGGVSEPELGLNVCDHESGISPL